MKMRRTMKKRILSAIFAVMLLCSAGLSCGKEESPVADNENRVSEDTQAPVSEPVKKDKNAVFAEAGTVGEYSAAKSNYTLTADASNKICDVSDLLYGIFFEDINFAADGGLYAEMVQNRSFEYGNIAKNNEMHSWSVVGNADVSVVKDDKTGCLNMNNPNYVLVKNTNDTPAGLKNRGFLDGMSIVKGEKYRCSFYAKAPKGYVGKAYACLTVGNETVSAAEITGITDEWVKYEAELTSDRDSYKNVFLQLTIDKGEVAFDMISLFPRSTYKNRENGLRADLAEKLAELSPAFVRFPGGCVTEGYNLSLAYDWKDSVGVDENRMPLLFNGVYGDVAARKMGQNIWTDERMTNDNYPSFMTYGLGFYEFFLLSEDIGAVGVPVLNCGMCCQAQGIGEMAAIGSAKMDRYIKDALDLVEFCRGDETTPWGKARISMGHKEPFALKYICIGNEQWGNEFYRRYAEFVDAFEKAKKEKPALFEGIELIYSSGTDDGEGGNYRQSYDYAAKWLKAHPDKTINDFAGATDQHYYNTPEWFLSHNDYYDEANYSRDFKDYSDRRFSGGIKVFLGEYAAQSNTLKAALAEASYMTGLERNSDIVVMAAYAPLFGNTVATHWAPDLIWFNNRTVTPSINYYVQQLFSKNAATQVLASEMENVPAETASLSGKVGVATWSTAAKFDNVKVTDNKTGEVLAFTDFSEEDSIKKWTMISDGKWSVKDGELLQTDARSDVNRYGNTGAAAYFENIKSTDYTLTLDATKLSGSEGFLIPFAVKDKNNNYFWNIGGWNNTVSCLQIVSNGSKSGQVGNVKNCTIKTNKTYKLKIVVSDCQIKCYIDDKLYVDYDMSKSAGFENYQVTGYDEETGDYIIKFVNTSKLAKTVAIDLKNVDSVTGKATVHTVKGTSLGDDNILGRTESVTLVTTDITIPGASFNYTVPAYSVTAIRVHTK